MKRIVIKVGSHVLGKEDGLNLKRIYNLCEFLAELKKKYEIILVSSGAVSAGWLKLKLDKSILENKQAMSAVGQPYLMSIYARKFEKFGIYTAQVLLSADDFDSRRKTKHARNAIETLLKNSVLPIINENDTTTIKELVFGDNDQLSAHVAYYFDAELLVILSDIDAYYDKNPHQYLDAKPRKIVHQIDKKDLECEHTPNSNFATGGIVTKLKAADFLLKHNRQMFLSSGFDLDDIKSYLLENKHIGGTLFCNK